MRIAHFSDTHLGYRAYGKLAENGLNQREVDVFKTFDRCLSAIVEAEPDIIIHTGDLFHVVRPSNHVIVQAYRRLMDAQAKRNGKPFIIIAGNHETPRSVETGCILKLFGDEVGGGIPGVYVAVDKLQRFQFDGAEIFCMPNVALAQKEESVIAPEATTGISVLAAHGLDSSLKLCASDFRVQDMKPERWDYIALGDYHIYKALSPNAIYCGSTDYTSSNIWEEIGTPKGWVLFDSAYQSAEFHSIEPSRVVLDLKPVDADGLGGAEIGEKLVLAADWKDELPIVRQRIINLEGGVRGDIPSEVVREIKSRALQYSIEMAFVKSDIAASTFGGAGRSLEDDWREYAGNRELPVSMVKEKYVDTGLDAMKEAENVTAET